jgi:ferric-dicitrate binding protein FerR (iron transport regulator)
MITKRLMRQLAGLDKTPQQMREQRELRRWLKTQREAQEAMELVEKINANLQAQNAGRSSEQ